MKRKKYLLPTIFFYRNWLFCLALATLIAGAGLGNLTANNLPSEHLIEIEKNLSFFLEQVVQHNINSAQAVRSIMHENIIFVVFLYFLGLTFVGIPFILGLVLGRGFVIGFAVSCLLKTMICPGFIFVVISMLPHNLLYLPAILIGAMAAISFASLTLKRHGGEMLNLWSCFLGYTLIMLAVMSITMGACLIEVYFSPWLTRLASGLIQITNGINSTH